MSKILETETEGYGPSFAIHGFMRYLGLRPAQLVAYALIYSCTVDKGCYDFGAAVLADWSGTSERTARTTIASLLEMGLIVERGSHVHGMNTVGRSLVAAADPISRAREAWLADHPDAGRSCFRISPEEISRENTSSPEISSREDLSSPAKVSRDVSSPEVSSPEKTSSPEEISRENTSSPEISSREDFSSPAKVSRDVSSPEVSSPEKTSSPEEISRENTSSPEISSREDFSSPAKVSRDVSSPEVSSPEKTSSPEEISRENTSSPEISSREDFSSPAKVSRDVSSPEVSSPEKTSSPEEISRENTSSPEISSREDFSSPAKVSRDVSSPEVSSPEKTSSPEEISRENTSSPEISSREDFSSPAKVSRDVSSPEVSSPEKTSSPETISRENTSSPEISSREDSSSPAIFSGESPYIPISNDYPEDWTDGWMDFQTDQPDVYPGMDSQVDTASDFRKIADETINRNKLDAARQPYDELRNLGFGADEIGAAWARRQAEAKDAGCEDKFMPQLRKWLLDTSVKGCRKMVEAARQRTGRGEKHLRRAPDGAWLIIGDGPVHPVVDANGIVYRGDNKEAAIDLARKQATSSL
ncbi:hypothetical protein [Collinsella sp. AM13-34]|uniref:hypothetical protein n=1 Tax=Collinsella sp. AM13-34 TaxID=2292024 RepID=UPI0011C22CE5|nr:hypothetical protein [Collinsella sp. AM13-34]